jgi:general secretion pathway protein J
MRFVADLPDYLGRGGPYLHELTLVNGEGGQRLEVAFTLVLAGETKAETPPRAPELLAGPLREATFRYRAMKSDNTIGDWQDQWTAGDRLPLQVEITLQDADGRNWPPMVMTLPLAAGYVGSAL